MKRRPFRRFVPRSAGRVGALAAIALAAAVLVAAGWAGVTGLFSKVTTAAAIGRAWRADFHQPSIRLTLSLAVTPAQVGAWLGPAYPGGMPPGVAASLAGAAVRLDVATGHGEALDSAAARTDAANQCDLAVDVAGSDVAEVRQIGPTVYANVDVAAVSAAAGIPLTVPPGLTGGTWVSLPASQLGTVLSLLGGPAVSAPVKAGAGSSVRQLIAGLRLVLGSGTTFRNEGDHAGRTEYLVAMPLGTAASGWDGVMTGGLGLGCGVGSWARSVPDDLRRAIPVREKVQATVWVSGGRAQEVDVDLNQLGHVLPFRVPLRIDIGPGGGVSAPVGAVPLP